MAIFRPSSEPSPRALKLKWKLPLACGISASILVACYSLYGHSTRSGWYGWDLHELIFLIASVALFAMVFSLVMYVNLPRAQRRAAGREYEITPAGISRRYPPFPDLFVPVQDVLHFEARKNGLILRLRQSPGILPISADLIGFEQIPSVLEEMGIPQMKLNRRPVVLRFLLVLACLVPILVCPIVLFFAKNLRYVAVAGIGFLAFMAWTTLKQRKSPYQRERAGQFRWSAPATLLLWTFVVAMRVWSVSHPHAHRIHAADSVTQPCRPDQTKPAAPPSH
jgi:hypothetical protein